MVNIENGLARFTLVVSSLLAFAAFLFGAAALYGVSSDTRLATIMFGIGVGAFAIPWLLFLVCRWIARGFTSGHVNLPIYNPSTGEVTLAGYDPAGSDFPLGGAHATFTVLRPREDGYDDPERCVICHRSVAEAVIIGTPRGLRCLKHAEWYSRLTVAQHYALVVVFWLITLVGLATCVILVWRWLQVR